MSYPRTPVAVCLAACIALACGGCDRPSAAGPPAVVDSRAAAGIAREIERLRRAQRDARQYADDRLNPQQRFERDYLLAVIGADLSWLERARFPFTNPAWYIDQLDPQVYLMLGKLMIRKLRTDWAARHSDDAAKGEDRAVWGAFHDAFLSYGGPPIPLVRRAMVGEGGSLF